MNLSTKKVHKGRGAVSNPAGRFESLHRQWFDDGWAREDEEPLPLETIVKADPARSIITRNESPDLSFSLTINPYRGCEQGCVYCMSGDTRILMADGSTRPLADIRVGDEICGTARNGHYRRYVRSRVLAHWRVIKPAYRITLEDGTTLTSGADHRFLTDRGWKHVTGAEQGTARRPHLTVNNKLTGTGAFADGPLVNDAYRRGYLCGVIRGDGHLGEYRYEHPRKPNGDYHYRFRLALCDDEALQRARQYLSECSVETQEFAFGVAMAGRQPMRAIRASARQAVSDIRQLVAWPAEHSREWGAGFLAGIFDAEGCFSGSLRISNTNAEIIDWIGRCLSAFGFKFIIEHTKQNQPKPVDVVRLLGGFREQLRFFHTTEPAIQRKRKIVGQALKSDAKLRILRIEPLGYALPLYDITTETEDFIANGIISHNCFARPSHAYLNLSPGLDFETKLFYKENAAALFDKELRKPGYRCEPISIGLNTDAYQPIERTYRVTRSLLEVALRFRQPVFLVTKGAALMERDLDILGELGRARLLGVAVSITSLKDEIKRTLEPRTASPARRLKLVRQLTDAGVPVMVMVAPVIPFITDGEMEKILEAARDAGAVGAGYVMLRLPWEVKELFEEWLRAHYPDRADHVMSLMRQLHGGAPQHRPREVVTDPEGFNQDAPPEPAALEPDRYRRNEYYSSQWHVRGRGSGPLADLVAQRFRLACRRLHLNEQRLELDTSQFRVPPAAGDQLGLVF